jgi:chemotaxis response regulator CheB
MRIGIVNDVRIAAEIMRRTVLRGGRHKVSWVAGDGSEAVEKCRADQPDLILMDMLMPRMDGVEATKRIMQETPCPILVVTASVDGNASMVLDALGHGALDAVTTPILGGMGASATAKELMDKIDEIAETLRVNDAAADVPATDGAAPTPVAEVGARHVVLIGVGSGGGPNALTAVLAGLDASFPAGIIVIQHLDSEVALGLAEWLDGQTPLKVKKAATGDLPAPGSILVPGSSDHMMLSHDGRIAYTHLPPSQYRPSVDVLFRSVAERWRGSGTAVLLTGAGEDGAEGLLALRRAGFHTIAQDKDSSAAYGMPKAAIELGAAVDVLPLEKIGAALIARQGAPSPEVA